MHVEVITLNRGKQVVENSPASIVIQQGNAEQNRPADTHILAFPSLTGNALPVHIDTATTANEVPRHAEIIARKWTSTLERKYDDLVAKYVSGQYEPADLQDLLELRIERRALMPNRSGVEFIGELKRIQATDQLTAAFENYVKVVGTAR